MAPLDRRGPKPTSKKIDNINAGNPFIEAAWPICRSRRRIHAHSIIAVRGTGPPQHGSDGVVSYESAHIDWAVSEKVVRWNHSCQGTPEAIEEIRRILYLHAAEADAAAAPPPQTRPKAKKVRAAAP